MALIHVMELLCSIMMISIIFYLHDYLRFPSALSIFHNFSSESLYNIDSGIGYISSIYKHHSEKFITEIPLGWDIFRFKIGKESFKGMPEGIIILPKEELPINDSRLSDFQKHRSISIMIATSSNGTIMPLDFFVKRMSNALYKDQSIIQNDGCNKYLIHNRKACTFTFTYRKADIKDEIRGEVVITTYKDTGYIFIFTSSPINFESNLAQFNIVLSSFRFLI